MYTRQHDHTLKQAAKQGAVEAVMEHDNIKVKWEKIGAQIANELAEKQALTAVAGEGSADEEEEETVVPELVHIAFGAVLARGGECHRPHVHYTVPRAQNPGGCGKRGQSIELEVGPRQLWGKLRALLAGLGPTR